MKDASPTTLNDTPPITKRRSPCMDKLDGLGWSHGATVVSHGVRLGIRTNDADILTRLLERLPHGWRSRRAAAVERLYSGKVGAPASRPGVRQFNLLYRNPARLSRTLALDAL